VYRLAGPFLNPHLFLLTITKPGLNYTQRGAAMPVMSHVEKSVISRKKHRVFVVMASPHKDQVQKT
jgi:hypothetical protein